MVERTSGYEDWVQGLNGRYSPEVVSLYRERAAGRILTGDEPLAILAGAIANCHAPVDRSPPVPIVPVMIHGRFDPKLRRI